MTLEQRQDAGKVVYLNPNSEMPEHWHEEDDPLEQDHQVSAESEGELQQRDPPKSRTRIIIGAGVALLVLMAALFVFSQQANSALEAELADAEIEAADSSVELQTVNADLRQSKMDEAAAVERATDAEEANGYLEFELAGANDRIATMVEPEVAAELEAELVDANSVIDVQIEVIEQYRVDNQSLEEQNRDLQISAEAAKAEAYRAQVAQSAQSVRAADAAAALELAHEMVASRAQATMRTWSGASLGSKVYHLGTVEDSLVRNYFVWNDETQFFKGTGEIRFMNNMEDAQVKLLNDQTIQAILPLPTVDDAKHVYLEGEWWTEREQLARVGGRWGEQTHWFVDTKAEEKTRNLACNDVTALRYQMSKVLNRANQMTNGYQLDVRWIDSKGLMRTSVTDEQLLASVC